MDSIREKVPVLLNGDDETVEVVWKQRLQKGVYKLEIELLGNSGEVLEHRETIIESNLSPYSNVSAVNNSTSGTETSSAVLHQLDQKIIYPHYDFKHLTEKYFEIGMKLRNS